ncbi:MAG: glycosyltransferase [Candidatus Omnitrophota bacterium]
MNNPFISIIIPVYNDSQRLKKCLDALHDQTYPADRYEIIVVDNNSTEDIKSLVERYPKTIYTFEKEKRSYAARNKGLSIAQGEIIAFTDSDCIPCQDWLHEGSKPIIEGTADLVGGKIAFIYSAEKSSAEFYDSIVNMQHKENIHRRKIGKTANLFVKKNVFDIIGLFPTCCSGGDVIWTKSATQQGIQIYYQKDATVKHPARKLIPLLKKSFRVGKGQPYIWLELKEPKRKFFTRTLLGLLPPSPRHIRKLTEERGTPDMSKKLLSIWGVAWLCRFATFSGRVITIVKNLSQIIRA